MPSQLRGLEYELPPDPRKRLVQTPEALEAMVAALRGARELFFDFETSGTAWSLGSRGCGLALGRFVGEGPDVDAWYVPYRHLGHVRQMDHGQVNWALKRVLGDPASTKVAHNCLANNSMVTLADGSRREISHMVRDRDPGPVVCVDEATGRLTTRPVVGWLRGNARPLSDWRILKTVGIGQLRLTVDHEVLTPTGRRRVDSLKTGDKVLCDTPALSDIERAMLTGSLMGLMRIYLKSPRAASAIVTHPEGDKAYAQFKRRVLRRLRPRVLVTDYGKRLGHRADGPRYTMRMQSHVKMLPIYFANRTLDGKQLVTQARLGTFGKDAFAIWMCDQARCTGTSVTLWATKFGDEGAEMIAARCRSFGWPARAQRRHNDSEIYLIVRGSVREGPREVPDGQMRAFWEEIAPLVPPCKAHLIWLGARHLCSEAHWVSAQPADCFVDTVVSVKTPEQSYKPRTMHRLNLIEYCLEVEGHHNFFGANIAVSNCKFDTHFARIEGWPVAGPRYCTLIAAKLYDEQRPAGLKARAHSDLGWPDAHLWDERIHYHVDALAKRYGASLSEYRAKVGYSEVPVEICGRYACHDIAQCAGLYHLYERTHRLSARYPRVVKTEMALLSVLEAVEAQGLPVDANYLCSLRERAQASMRAIEAQVWAAMPPSVPRINLGNDGELRRLLMHHLHLPLSRQTKSRTALAIDREVLEQFAGRYPALLAIASWRDCNKILSTYTQSILDRLDEGDVVHCDFVQTGARTGRMSSREPNMQNLPKDSRERALQVGPSLKDGGRDPLSVRAAFTVPEGFVRLLIDYSQVELRVIAWYTRDPTLLAAYAEGEDVHTRTSVEVFGTEDKRDLAKVVNFGISYCMSAMGLSRQAKISVEEAQNVLKRYYSRFSSIEEARLRFWAQTRANNGHFVNGWGRPQRAPNLSHPDPGIRRGAERQAFAALIQGTAAELTKESMVRIHGWLTHHGMRARLVNTIHDEIQIDAPYAEAPDVLIAAKRLMTDYPEFAPVPITVGTKMARQSWADCSAKASELP